MDGNDVLTVHEAVQEAVSRARKREGPTLIECKTYRWRPHCEVPALENEPWRPQEEIDEWKGKDPVEQMKTLLLDRRVLSEDEDESIRARIRASLEEALEYAQGSPDPSPDEATQGIYDAESD